MFIGEYRCWLDGRPDLVLRFPSDWKLQTPRTTSALPNAQVSEFSMRLPKSGLANAKIEVVGLEQTLIDVLIRVTPAEGVPFRTILRASNASTIIPAEPTLWMVSTSYFRLGWDHILEGIDHLAFVLLVLLLARDSRSILSTVTAFTLAHSITLSAVTLGWASLPAAPVEAGIALSIVFLAAELATAPWSQHPTLTQQRPWLVCFGFGLLHGFGFAGALREAGLPADDIPIALATFNLGVEAGQLAFVMIVLAFLYPFRYMARSLHPHPYLSIAAAYLVGSVGTYWWVGRLVGCC